MGAASNKTWKYTPTTPTTDAGCGDAIKLIFKLLFRNNYNS